MISRYFVSRLSSFLVFALLASVSFAHVALDSPNGGESYRPGQQVTVTWHAVVDHSTTGWTLEYSTSSASGPWIPINLNLPAGNTAAGVMHQFIWTVPNNISSTVWVRVQQVNPGTDYFDESDSAFTIKDALSSSTSTMSLSAGGSQVIDIDAGPDFDSYQFMMLGNFSGTNNGVSYQGLGIPLNHDSYLERTIHAPNYPPLTNSLGVLPANGQAQTIFTLAPNQIAPSAAGFVVHHAVLVVDPTFQVALVSNPVGLTLIP